MTRRERIFELAAELGIKIRVAKAEDKNETGIHLLHPDLDALEDALQTAERDLFPAIYIHRGNPQGFTGARNKTVGCLCDGTFKCSVCQG